MLPGDGTVENTLFSSISQSSFSSGDTTIHQKSCHPMLLKVPADPNILSGSRTLPRLPDVTNSVPHFYGQSFSVQPGGGGILVCWLQDFISAIHE